MNKLFTFILAPLLLCTGCSEDDDVLPQQKEKIVSYLTKTHLPNLVAYEALEEGSRAAYYTISGNTVYSYIEEVYNPDRGNWREVTASSKVSITFRAYVFSYKEIKATGEGQTMPFWTNDPQLKEPLQNAGLNTEWWSFEPLTIDMSSPGAIKGLQHALLGCREGDYVEAYMTYNMGYGDDNYFGLVPKESPVAYFFTVDRVE